MWSEEGQPAFNSGKRLLRSPAQVRSKYNSRHIGVSVAMVRGNEAGIEQLFFCFHKTFTKLQIHGYTTE